MIESVDGSWIRPIQLQQVLANILNWKRKKCMGSILISQHQMNLSLSAGLKVEKYFVVVPHLNGGEGEYFISVQDMKHIQPIITNRSEERRVGKEYCTRRCKDQYEKKTLNMTHQCV